MKRYISLSAIAIIGACNRPAGFTRPKLLSPIAGPAGQQRARRRGGGGCGPGPPDCSHHGWHLTAPGHAWPATLARLCALPPSAAGGARGLREPGRAGSAAGSPASEEAELPAEAVAEAPGTARDGGGRRVWLRGVVGPAGPGSADGAGQGADRRGQRAGAVTEDDRQVFQEMHREARKLPGQLGAEVHRHVHGPLHGRLEHGFPCLQFPPAEGAGQHVKGGLWQGPLEREQRTVNRSA